MKPVELLSVFAENKPGQLARITRVLAEARANIRWITFATSERFGVIKVLVDQTAPALAALLQDGLAVSLIEVLAADVPDQPGALLIVTDCLAAAGVNIENASGFVANHHAIVLLEVADLPGARRVLAKAAIPLLSQEQMLSL